MIYGATSHRKLGSKYVKEDNPDLNQIEKGTILFLGFCRRRAVFFCSAAAILNSVLAGELTVALFEVIYEWKLFGCSGGKVAKQWTKYLIKRFYLGTEL